MTPLFTARNGLHPKTASVIFACHWCLMLNPSVPHFIEASIFYHALQLAHACTGGFAGRCEEHQ